MERTTTRHDRTVLGLLFAGVALSALHVVSGGAALALGLAFGLTLGAPVAARSRKTARDLLALSVVGLGAGMDLRVVARAGLDGVAYTVVGIGACLGLGLALIRLFRIDWNTGLLISVGTAICGGSAIAAVAPTLRPREHEVTVALATVFLLNAIALFVFPAVGRALELDEGTFGLWAALAIHDTSSVVGAASSYGAHALEVATTVKLTRALWIVPVGLGIGAWVSRRAADAASPIARAATPKPWFIVGFLAMVTLVTLVPALKPLGERVSVLSRHAMSATLFLIGASLTRPALRAVGLRPLLHGVVLWVGVATCSLVAVAAHLAG